MSDSSAKGPERPPDWLPRSSMFRREAMAHHAETRDEGVVLRISPRWSRWTYWILIAVLLVAAAYAVLGTVDEYASGPAIIRVEGKKALTARAAGTVQTVVVRPGQRVRAGDLLVELYVAEERASLERVEHELDLQLVKMLRDPTDQTARQSLIGLRAEAELATARLDERLVRSPLAGVVSDVRIRPGQHLDAGELLLSIVGDEARFTVIAMLPGHYRPRLRAGMSLRVELTGYRYVYHDLSVDEIGDEVIGASEIRRFLGPELADTVAVTGPVVLVRARLDSKSFVREGSTYNYFDGMQGLGEARVRSETVLVTLVPGLEWVFGG